MESGWPPLCWCRPPLCWCRKGRMPTRQARAHALNPGRYFYRCPYNLDHANNFIWCDVFHKNDPLERLPHFLRTSSLPFQNSNYSGSTSRFLSSVYQDDNQFTPPRPTEGTNVNEATSKRSVITESSTSSKGRIESEVVDNSIDLTKNGAVMCFCCGCVTMVFISISILLFAILLAKMGK